MKAFIYEVDLKKRVIYCIINRKKEGFYLSNRLAKTFLSVLKPNLLIDFEVSEKITKKYGTKVHEVYPVLFFNKITQVDPKRVLYDLKELRLDMKKVLKKYKTFLFIDLEMSMPGFKEKTFIPEIIQVGYVLSNTEGEVIVDKGYYLLPKNENAINKRTIKFLNLDENVYYGKGREYEYFYEDLKKIINQYNPQFVVWGKNDISALKLSYKLHDVEPLTTDKQFIDLLKLHKDYFNLSNDIGLFDAYQKYYDVDDLVQEHDARTDAIITKDVFDAFLHMK